MADQFDIVDIVYDAVEPVSTSFILYKDRSGDGETKNHITIRIASLRYIRTPAVAPSEHLHDIPPGIPQVICDPPHICVCPQMLRLLQHCRSRRKTEHDLTPAVQDRIMQQLDLISTVLYCIFITCLPIFDADIIDLNKIHAPGSIQLNN